MSISCCCIAVADCECLVFLSMRNIEFPFVSGQSEKSRISSQVTESMSDAAKISRWMKHVSALSRKESHLGKKKCCFPLYFLGCVKMCKNKLRWWMVNNHGCIWRNMYLFYICWFPKTCGKQPQLDYLHLSQYLCYVGLSCCFDKKGYNERCRRQQCFPSGCVSDHLPYSQMKIQGRYYYEI